MSLFAKMIATMQDTPDGDGTLLDHSIMLYGTGMGDGDHHTPYNLPVTLVGGGAAVGWRAAGTCSTSSIRRS